MAGNRILGLDFGSKTVGVAISDPLLYTAQGLEIIRRDRENKIRKTLVRIEEICSEYEVSKIVLGLPLNMDDSEGERALKTRAFAEDIERRTGLEVIFWDERLTTVEADETMDELGIFGAKRKELVDEIAAMIILQSYLENIRDGKN